MPPGLDVNAMVQWKMLQQRQRMQKRRSEFSDEDGSSDSNDGHNSSSKLRSILRLRKRVRSHPLRIVTKYRRRCLDKVGIVVLPNGSLSAPLAHHHTPLRGGFAMACPALPGLDKIIIG